MESNNKPQSMPVQPSYRWAARLADLGLWTPVGFLVFVPLLLTLDGTFPELAVLAYNYPLLTLTITSAVFLCILMLIDALVGVAFGNTPGKSLLRIRVSEPDGSPLTAHRRLKRNMGVATLGMGLSTPLLGWLFWLIQYFIVRSGHKATYDRIMGYSVSQAGRIGFGRGCFFAILFFVAIALQGFSTKLANEVVNPHGWYIGLMAISEASTER